MGREGGVCRKLRQESVRKVVEKPKKVKKALERNPEDSQTNKQTNEQVRNDGIIL